MDTETSKRVRGRSRTTNHDDFAWHRKRRDRSRRRDFSRRGGKRSRDKSEVLRARLLRSFECYV